MSRKKAALLTSIFALLVAILSLWFAVLVGRQYARNRKYSNFFWLVSLLFSAGGSLAYCVSMWTTPHSSVAFVLYYLLGAMWMPSLMGLGSMGLVTPAKAMNVVAAIVILIGLVGSVLLFQAPVSQPALQALAGGAGTGIIGIGLWLVSLIVLNSFGALAVFIVALISAWRTWKRHAPKRFFLGNLWLAIGILVISMAGTAARMGFPQMFWITMLIGWVITFFGYRLLANVVARTSTVPALSSS